MGDLVLGLARSVVQGALTRAQTAIEEDAKLRQRAQRDLVFISLEFEMMQAFINVAKQDELRDNVAKTWVRYVRDLAYDFEDCIELVVHLDNSPNWWWRLLPSFMAPPRPLDLAVAELELLRSRAEDVSNSYSRYSRINNSATKLVMLQQPAIGTTEEPAIGATPLDMLIKARDTSKTQHIRDLTQFLTKKDDVLELQVIWVWGTAGDLGSTSVITEAYNDDPEINRAFKCRAWVKVMHPFDPHEFIRCLMGQFHANSCEEPDAIIGVHVLVVLEDVSIIVEWNIIRSLLPDRKNGSCIIVSTQQFEMASLCVGHSYQVLELKQFSAEHSVCAFFKEVSLKHG